MAPARPSRCPITAITSTPVSTAEDPPPDEGRAGTNVLDREQLLPISRAEAFEFFSDALNLEAITPPWLHFRVTTERPIDMGPGTLIAYRLRLHGIPVRWLTEIRSWEPDDRFRDVQLKGPYSLWDHTHTFTDDGKGGTVMRDRVVYRIPFGPLGTLAHRLFVRRDVERIFDFRAEEIERRLDGGAT